VADVHRLLLREAATGLRKVSCRKRRVIIVAHRTDRSARKANIDTTTSKNSMYTKAVFGIDRRQRLS